MIPARLIACAALACLLAASPLHAHAQRDADGRVYGTVETRDGDRHTGFIRWDKNEVGWLDILDGDKVIRRDDDERRRSFLGISVRETADGSYNISWDDDSRTRQSGIRFGHIAVIEPTGRDAALIHLRSGQKVELVHGSTDIGTELRGIIVEDAGGAHVEFDWRDIDRVTFAPAPRGAASGLGERLYGTLTTRRGDAFTGFVGWDVDEALTLDELDGDDANDRRHRIPFGRIAMISRAGFSRALVRLHDGDELTLHGTNDVDDDNNGILVLVPGLGQVRVEWDEFDSLVFSSPERQVDRNDFRNAGRLRGTVFTHDGDKLVGHIRWDDDEAYAWELLNGSQRGASFAIEMGYIREIVRLSGRMARVTLHDGRVLELGDSNDVDRDNDGIVVETSDGAEVLVDWDDFERVVFEKP